MSFELGLSKTVARIAAIAIVAIGASACSSVPHWVDPTNWMGDGDQSTAADSDHSSAQTPDLASIPDKPAAPSTVDERKQVADTLKADRADAQYSADALRGGTEASAAPPGAAPAAETETISASSSPAAAPTQTANAEPASQPAPAAAPAAPQTTEIAAPSQDAAAAPAAPPPAAAEVASTAPAPAMTAASTASDDQLGFQTSKAPPLDPNVAHFVSRSVLDQYQQSSTDMPATSAPALTPPAPAKADTAQKTSQLEGTSGTRARETYANAGATEVRGIGGASYKSMVTPAAYTPGQNSQPNAIVFFPRDAAVLNAKAKAQILTAAQSYQSRDGAGFVRVVGHSSSRTSDMPMARHLAVVFEHSQDFATAVAQELVKDGVPADKVLIEAVGDSQPVYYESMPQGEAGNRRAEIFL
jgi:outer membrane protein OmpA-like peptidoglycan-associated protein